MKKPKVPMSKMLLESLEARIAPAGLAGITYLDVTLGTPQLLHAGQGLKANNQYLLAVTQGQALIFTTDINGNNQFDPNEITGIAAGNGLKLTSFVNINGDIVTNLLPNGTLSDTSGNADSHNGLLLLNSTIDAITLRSETPADVTPSDIAYAQTHGNPGATAASIYTNFLAPSTYSINGNIYAGGGVGDGAIGDGVIIDTAGSSVLAAQFPGNAIYYSATGVVPQIGSIKTGTAAAGSTFSFGYYATNTTGQLGQQYVGTPGVIPTLSSFTPGIGQAGGSIIGLMVGNGAATDTGNTPSSPSPFTINAIDAGNGGIGGAGGSIKNITFTENSGGLQMVAGDGGDGPIGGNGGSIINLNDVPYAANTNAATGNVSMEGVVQIQTGNGGEGYLGSGGNAGTIVLGQFAMDGDVHMSLGHGGDALANAGSGNSLGGVTLTPGNSTTSPTSLATAVSVITTYRTAGDIGTPKLIDFNDDGYTDAIIVTQNPDQIGIVFGGPSGLNTGEGLSVNNAVSNILWLTSPNIGAQTFNSPDVAVGDFTGQYYADGTPILDIAVANSSPSNTAGINIFLNPATQTGLGDGYHGTLGSAGPGSWSLQSLQSATGQNFISTPTLTVPLPTLNSNDTSNYLFSGGAVTNLVVGDFNHATYSAGKPFAPAFNPILDLAYTTQVFSAVHGPVTETVMLQGTGDGHFFANFDYNSTTGQPNNMPVLDSGQTYGLGQGAFQLVATAAVSGDPNSDMLVLAGLNSGGGGNVKFIQDLNPTQVSALNGNQGLGFSSNSFITSDPFSGLPYSGFVLTTTKSVTPTYDYGVYNPGLSFVTAQAVPEAIAVTTHPGPIAGSDNSGNAFSLITLDQGNAITMIEGAYTPVAGSVAGLATTSNNTTANTSSPGVQGVLLIDPHPNGLLAPPHSDLYGIVAGDFTNTQGYSGSSPSNLIQFSIFYSDASGGPMDTGFQQFTFPADGLLHLKSSYNADLKLNGDITLTGAIDGYSKTIVAFGLYNLNSHTTDSTINPPQTTLNNTLTNEVGYIGAIPSTTADNPIDVASARFAGLIRGVGPGLGSTTINNADGTTTVNDATVSLALNTYSLTLSAGNAGNSRVGSGGAGGVIGSATNASSLTVTVPILLGDQPLINLHPGVGGSGLINGGAGGGFQNLNLAYATGTSVLGGVFNLTAGDGGNGLYGSGGNGGGLSNFQVQTGEVFAGGNGGSGYRGGTGGTINGSAGINGYSSQNDIVVLTGGNGGNGIVSGGNGGTITGFAAEFLGLVTGAEGYLNYLGGTGGNAIGGTAGAGGSILNSSPFSQDNNLSGPIILTAGGGGNGLTGGAGGSISNFANASTTGTPISVVSITAGNGGTGVSGNGGAGGNVGGSLVNGQPNIYAAGAGIDRQYGYNFNSVLAGTGGASYGAAGGNGGSLINVTNVAQSSSEAMAAGAGGEGLTRGGNGGSLTGDIASSALSSTSKLLVFAGAGGDTYGALSTAVNVANLGDTNSVIISLRAFGGANGIAGNGGSITGFQQLVGTTTATDMIAGNGGSTLNYGSSTATSTNAGAGGSITNTKLLGNAGRAGAANANVAIVNYNNGDIAGFVANTLAFVPAVLDRSNPENTIFFSENSTTPQTLLTDSLGNVGLVVGGSGSVKGGLQAGDSANKTGSLINFTANNLMSLVAGSVDKIAAVNTVSGLNIITGNSGAGSAKTVPIPHDPATAIYFDASGAEISSPQINGSLMDGAVVIRSGGNKDGLIGQRIFVLS